MNYLEELKAKETKLINLQAKALAKKQSFEEMKKKRELAEAEALAQFGISLSLIPAELEKSKQKIEEMNNTLEQEIKKIEDEFAKLKC